MNIDQLIADDIIPDPQRSMLARASELGADESTLQVLLRASYVHQGPGHVMVPQGRYELAGGAGGAWRWGDPAARAERTKTCYVLEPGYWVVRSSVASPPGLAAPGDKSRLWSQSEWTVREIEVGAETWTIAL